MTYRKNLVNTPWAYIRTKDKFDRPMYGWAYIRDVNWFTLGPRIPGIAHYIFFFILQIHLV